MTTNTDLRDEPRRQAPRGEFSIGGELWAGISKLVEEAGEVIDVLSDPTQIRMTEELGDLDAAVEFVAARNNLDRIGIHDRYRNTLEGFVADRLCPDTCLLHSLGRLIQTAGKIIGNEGRHSHWDGSHLPSRLTENIGDARAAIIFYAMHRGINGLDIRDRSEVKQTLFNNWHRETLSRRKGTL
jgi:hypothetical protein